MTCLVCHRAFALAPLALWSVLSVPVNAQTDPAMPSKQIDTTAPATGPQVTTQSDINHQNADSPNKGKIKKGVPQDTPAQKKYGPPKNPLTDGLANTDLTKPLTLQRAIDIALQQQDQIAIAQAQYDAAKERVVQARSTYFPQITPTFQYESVKTPGSTTYINGIPISSANQSDTRTEVLAAQQLIYDSGKREATVGQNRSLAFGAEYNVGDQRQTVILNVISDYFNILRDQELVRVDQDNVRLAQANLDSINAQIAVGNAAKSDALQYQSQLANAQVMLLQAQNNVNLAQTMLKNAMGITAPVVLTLADSRAATPNTSPDTTSIESYVRLAYTNRLDIKNQEEQVNAQGYALRIAKINAGIAVNATVTEGYYLDPNAGEERDFLVSITYPLFDAGNTRAIVRENRAILEQQRRTLDQLEQTVRLQVQQDYINRENARQQVVAGQAAVQSSQTNYDAALEKQKNGLINVVDVITAENQLLTAQTNLVQSIYNFYMADAMLQRDIGVNDPGFVPNVPHLKRQIIPPMQAGFQTYPASASVVSASPAIGSSAMPTDGKKP